LLSTDPGEVMPKPLETGDPRALGRFELLARLGEGGQGIVYLGRGPGPGEERVAVKVLRSTADASVLERLARELDAIHHLQPFVTAIDAATMTSGLIGTPSYIAPEQLSGARPTSAVDIFAWAVTMFFAATGRPAFRGDTVMAGVSSRPRPRSSPSASLAPTSASPEP
jgi:serine/threonine protein kinase